MKLVTSVTLKIVGIYCLIQSIYYIQPIINAFTFPYSESSVRVTLIVGAIITFLLFIGLGIYLITISDNLAENMAQKDPAVEISNKIEAKDLQVLAFSVVGIILIALSISKIFELGVKIFTLQCMKSDESFMEKVSIDTISSAIGFVIQFTIGILLFVFGGSVSNIWDTLKKRFQHERNMAD